jgi:hypothetical protein
VEWRVNARCRLVESDDSIILGETENISAGGALIAKERAARVGEQVAVEIVSSDPPVVVRRLAKVVRDCGKDGDGRVREAFAFEGGSAQARAQLLAALITVASRGGERPPR